MGGLAYVERDRRWLQQSASPDPHALDERHTDRFVTGKPVTGSPAPLNGPAFELTEDCRTSRNVLTSPALAFASVSSVFKEQSTLSADTAVPGTLFARWRTGGALFAAPWGPPIGSRAGRIATLPASLGCFNPVSASFFFGFVTEPSGAAAGTLSAHSHATTRDVTNLA